MKKILVLTLLLLMIGGPIYSQTVDLKVEVVASTKSDSTYEAVMNYVEKNVIEIYVAAFLFGPNFSNYAIDQMKHEKKDEITKWIRDSIRSLESEEIERISTMLIEKYSPILKAEFLKKVSHSYKVLDKDSCLFLREGEFEISMGDQEGMVRVLRKGNQQIENYKGKDYYFLLKWEDHCECEVTPVTSFDEEAERMESEKFIWRIYKIRDDFYSVLSLGKDSGFQAEVDVYFKRRSN